MWSDTVSLKKMSTEEYIRHPEFSVHSVAMSVDDGPIRYFYGDNMVKALALCQGQIVIAHNAKFDTAILNWVFGVKPALIIDTLSMSRALLGPAVKSHSLNSISEYLGHGHKVEGELVKTKGLATLTEDQHRALAVYAKHDVFLCREAFRSFMPHFPKAEYRIVDWCMKAYTEPKLLLDKPLLDQAVVDIDIDRAMVTAMFDESRLVSNVKFADMLREYGVDPPTKISKTTSLPTYAFAKGDNEFLELLKHPNQAVRTLVQARLKLKSNIEKTRTAEYADRASRGPWPVSLEYSGAQTTHRFSGSEGNPQNLGRGGVLRDSIVAPEGYTIITADFAQIELRITLCLAGEYLALADLEDGIDLYCSLATAIFGRRITKAEKRERHIGKSAVLGCGFGMGKGRFLEYVRNSTPDFTESEAALAVATYREQFAGVPRLWRQCEKALSILAVKGTNCRISDACDLPLGICPLTGAASILLPNGLRLKYPNLKLGADGYTYDSGKFGNKFIFGGALLENIAQALARIVMTTALMRVNKKYDVVHTVHDELVMLVKDEDVEQAKIFIAEQMTIQPEWMPSLPLAVELGVGKTYGDSK
jgi:DNA polymerase